MSFFLKLDGDKMAFGGIKSIPQDYEYISTTSASVFATNAGEFLNPLGIWAIGSSVRVGHAKGYLRGKQVIREDQLCYLADSQADLQILVATEKTLFIYQNDNRLWQPIENGLLYFGLNVPVEEADRFIVASLKGVKINKPWVVTTTYIERY